MTLRKTRMPADAALMLDLLPPSFQYPENENWSLQQDDIEDLAASVKSIKRIWPLLRVLQVAVPGLRDVLRGFVWEEDGKPVGMISALRRGSTQVWTIGNVSVLPEYRRRGIARQLVEATLKLIRERGGQIALLDVIEGNLPAYRLYEQVGFAHYDSSIEFYRKPAQALPECSLPTGCRVMEMGLTEWQPRYALAQRTTPPEVQKYEPVEIRRFRPSPVVRTLMPLLLKLQNVLALSFRVTAGETDTVAVARILARAGGDAEITLALDPAHEALAAYLLHRAVGQVAAVNPAQRITCSLRQRDRALMQAAEEAGFVRRYVYHKMGLLLH